MSKLNGDTKIIIDLINSRIDGVEKQIEKQIDKLDEKLTDKVHDHCLRIKYLEKLRNMGAGGLVVIGIIWAVIKFIY